MMILRITRSEQPGQLLIDMNDETFYSIYGLIHACSEGLDLNFDAVEYLKLIWREPVDKVSQKTVVPDSPL